MEATKKKKKKILQKGHKEYTGVFFMLTSNRRSGKNTKVTVLAPLAGPAPSIPSKQAGVITQTNEGTSRSIRRELVCYCCLCNPDAILPTA